MNVHLRQPSERSRVSVGIAAAVMIGLAACARAPLPRTADLAWQLPPAASESTRALWHFDETTGLRFTDSGPDHRDGVSGIDTRVAFGRYRNARQFTASINSFALVATDRSPRLGTAWTIEAWVDPSEYGPVECDVIAARWTDQPNEQSWMLGLTGLDRSAISGAPPRPDLFDALIARRGAGLLVFAFQPEEAGEPRAFLSTVAIETGRWTHVAVTQDGRELRMYIDGRLDAQFANTTAIRDAAVPLVIGNQLDARWLTESQGPLQVPSDAGQYPFYAFVGSIDEVRITDVALRPSAGKE
jgi:hypothetical protein